MIKSEMEKLQISGTAPELCVEAENILRKLRESFLEEFGDEFTSEIMDRIFENSKLSEEELDKKIEKELNHSANKTVRAIKKFLDELDDKETK